MLALEPNNVLCFDRLCSFQYTKGIFLMECKKIKRVAHV